MKSLRIGFAALAILGCGILAVSEARLGAARYAYLSKGRKASIGDFERALRLDENDPDSHLRLAVALGEVDRSQEAILHCERALSLRPNDQYAWLQIGYLRKHAGDLEGARQAFARGVELAPHYGQPHWRLGRVLLEMNRREEAFAELRMAVKRRPSYLADFLELAWYSSGGDPAATEAAVSPNDSDSYIAVARFFVKKNFWEAALPIFQRSGAASKDDLQTLASQLIGQGRYLDAFRVWQTTHAAAPACLIERGCLEDGGFEASSEFCDVGFGWCVPAAIETAIPKIDASVARSGKKSLEISFQGASNPAQPLVTQLVLVSPSSRYRLTFAARTADIKTGGLPLISIIDIGLGKKVAESAVAAAGTSDWQIFKVEFATADHTDAIKVMLNRSPCKYVDCPIFGSLWLDDFTLEKI